MLGIQKTDRKKQKGVRQQCTWVRRTDPGSNNMHSAGALAKAISQSDTDRHCDRQRVPLGVAHKELA